MPIKNSPLPKGKSLGDALAQKVRFSQRFPEQVFQGALGCFLFFEFSRAFGDKAWHLFARLSREFSDQFIRIKSIDPDAFSYYENHFNEAADFYLSPLASSDEYIKKMHNWPIGGAADALAYRADVIVWAGNSGFWACWGERESNLCVLHLAGDVRVIKEMHLQPDDYMPLLEFEEAMSDIVSGEFSKENSPEFIIGMRRHYCTLQRGQPNA